MRGNIMAGKKDLRWFISSLADYIAQVMIGVPPHAPGINELKRRAMIARGARVGPRLQLLSGVWIDTFKRLEIGEDVSVAHNVTMVAAGGVSIGNRAMIGHGSIILSTGHHVPSGRGSMRFTPPTEAPVRLEDDVWIGARAVVLPGVTIGSGAIIGAGAVVSRYLPPYAVAAGVPAKVIRIRE